MYIIYIYMCVRVLYVCVCLSKHPTVLTSPDGIFFIRPVRFSCNGWKDGSPSQIFLSIKMRYTPVSTNIHPGRLTWNLQITHLERNMIFQTSMIMFHVNLQGCSWLENEAFEDVFPIENGDIPASYVSLPEGKPGWMEGCSPYLAPASTPFTILNLPHLKPAPKDSK